MSAPFPAEPVPAQAGGTEQPPHGGMGMGRARHMPEVFQTWHDGKPPSSLPPSLLPQSVPQLLSFPHWSLMFCHRLPVGAGSRKWSCHSRRLSLLMFQLVSHKEMVKHNPLRAAGSWIEFFHLSPETALYSHTDKTNGLAGSDSDKAAAGAGPTSAVSPVMARPPSRAGDSPQPPVLLQARPSRSQRSCLQINI